MQANAAYIKVSAEVRYWEGASVNGIADEDGNLIPLRAGDLWRPVIRLSDGFVINWPHGTTADIHYKVCDAGEYWLLDDAGKTIAKWGGHYVPNDFLCYGDNGYGDYIIMQVAEDGKVIGWCTPHIDVAEPWHDEDDLQYVWIATK